MMWRKFWALRIFPNQFIENDFIIAKSNGYFLIFLFFNLSWHLASLTSSASGGYCLFLEFCPITHSWDRFSSCFLASTLQDVFVKGSFLYARIWNVIVSWHSSNMWWFCLCYSLIVTSVAVPHTLQGWQTQMPTWASNVNKWIS